MQLILHRKHDDHRMEFLIEERFELKEPPPTARDLARQKRDSWFRPEKRLTEDLPHLFGHTWEHAAKLR